VEHIETLPLEAFFLLLANLYKFRLFPKFTINEIFFGLVRIIGHGRDSYIWPIDTDLPRSSLDSQDMPSTQVAHLKQFDVLMDLLFMFSLISISKPLGGLLDRLPCCAWQLLATQEYRRYGSLPSFASRRSLR
jgi:hypothetical protein